MKKIKVDITFLISVGLLLITGFFIFSSASLGLLSTKINLYSNVIRNQMVFGFLLGILACFIISKTDYKLYRKYALFLFVASIIATLLVFVPKIGIEHGGAYRWIYLGPFSFQTSELLKIGFIIYLSTWLSNIKDKVKTLKGGFLPFLLMIGILGTILLSQPDTDTFFIIVLAGTAMFLAAGGKWRYFFILILVGIIGLGVIAHTRPYIMQRITTFMNPSENSQGSGYQIQQSLIAIGSGGFSGRGFGQSIQKFNNHLPEPIGDSIFAVASEEFGFIGSVGIIFLFLFFTFRGLKIASQTSDSFGRLMVLGIVIMIASQAFVNISSMVGILPLSGITLPFISQGGTALFMTLAEVGIILNISKNRKNK